MPVFFEHPPEMVASATSSTDGPSMRRGRSAGDRHRSVFGPIDWVRTESKRTDPVKKPSPKVDLYFHDICYLDRLAVGPHTSPDLRATLPADWSRRIRRWGETWP